MLHKKKGEEEMRIRSAVSGKLFLFVRFLSFSGLRDSHLFQSVTYLFTLQFLFPLQENEENSI